MSSPTVSRCNTNGKRVHSVVRAHMTLGTAQQRTPHGIFGAAVTSCEAEFLSRPRLGTDPRVAYWSEHQPEYSGPLRASPG